MIDLSSMKGIRVDPEARTVRAEPGVTWGQLDRETQRFGLATPGGEVPMTGIAGLNLGGGLGQPRRKHGLSCDNLVAVDLVTADGQFLTANEAEHADLFWGIRGGGQSLGVVTSFAFALHPVGPAVYKATVWYPFEQAGEVLRGWRAFQRTGRGNFDRPALERAGHPRLSGGVARSPHPPNLFRSPLNVGGTG